MNLFVATVLISGMTTMQSELAVARYEPHTYTSLSAEAADLVFHYRLLPPAQLEPGKTYPLVVFLHGAGERGDNNVDQLKYLPEMLAQDEYRAKYPCYVLAPQCGTDKHWVEVDWGADSHEQPAEPGPQMQALIDVMHQVQRHRPIDRQRIYLTGLSMGGYGSWDLAARHPDWFAAVVPICGGGDEATAARLVGVKLWAVHGDEDQAVPVERSRKMIAAIKAAGGEPQYTELKGVGHISWTPAYNDPQGVLPWMFEQKLEKK